MPTRTNRFIKRINRTSDVDADCSAMRFHFDGDKCIYAWGQNLNTIPGDFLPEDEKGDQANIAAKVKDWPLPVKQALKLVREQMEKDIIAANEPKVEGEE
jgi:hypothetical protein